MLEWPYPPLRIDKTSQEHLYRHASVSPMSWVFMHIFSMLTETVCAFQPCLCIYIISILQGCKLTRRKKPEKPKKVCESGLKASKTRWKEIKVREFGLHESRNFCNLSRKTYIPDSWNGMKFSVIDVCFHRTSTCSVHAVVPTWA